MRGKTGAARLALDLGIPVVPAAHWGTQQLMPIYSKRIRLTPAGPDRGRLRRPGRPVRMGGARHRSGGPAGGDGRDHDGRDRAARAAARRDGAGGSLGPVEARADRDRTVLMADGSRCSAPAAGAPRSRRCSPTPATTSRSGPAARCSPRRSTGGTATTTTCPGAAARDHPGRQRPGRRARRRRDRVPLRAEPVAPRRARGRPARSARRRPRRQPDEGRRERHRTPDERGAPRGPRGAGRPDRGGRPGRTSRSRSPADSPPPRWSRSTPAETAERGRAGRHQPVLPDLRRTPT